MAYTVMSDNGSEIYKNEINRLFDEYIQSELKIDPDEFRDPDNKKTVRDTFGDMILYIADHIEKPSNDDIELLDSIFEIYKRLCVRCGMLPTLTKATPFSTLTTGKCFSFVASVVFATKTSIGLPQQTSGTPLSFNFTVMLPQIGQM